jgi:hypothetical protein
VASCYGNRPSQHHGLTGVAQQPLGSAGSGTARCVRIACGHRAMAKRTAASNWVMRCGQTGGDSSRRRGESVGQGGTGGDAPRRRRDGEATGSAQDDSVPMEGQLW